MDVIIPLHATCSAITECDQKTRITVLIDAPIVEKNDEVYLHLNTDTHDQKLDLKMDKKGASVLLSPAFHYAQRDNDDDIPRVGAEEYTKRGADIARSLHFGSAIEYLAAWMNEDRKQTLLMRDIHAILSLGILTKLPQWIRHDIMMVLESETMKQIFASRFLTENKAEPMEQPLPECLKKPVHHNAADKTDPLISKLMTSVMQGTISYNGVAQQFETEAKIRMGVFNAICQG